MIKDATPISMAEASQYIAKDKDNTELKGFMKNFTKLDAKDATSMREKLEALDLMKLREKQITAIIDILPEEKEDLNKIFTDISLDEEEIKKILEVVKEFQ